jgi:hypothetical protein
MARTKRYRMRYDFQLNVAKADEQAIAEQIAVLKDQGLYSKTVRDGIRLVSDLRDGNLDVLFALFPWVRAEFLEYVGAVQPPKSEAEAAIAKQLARIEELLANDKSLSPVELGQGGGGPRKMNAPSVPAPKVDDDDSDLLQVKKSDSGGASAQNFLNSAFNLVQ